MQPNFRQATAPLDCEEAFSAMARFFRHRILSPQPPGAVRIGPLRLISRRLGTGESWSFSFCESLLRRRPVSGSSITRVGDFTVGANAFARHRAGTSRNSE